jgi:Transposase
MDQVWRAERGVHQLLVGTRYRWLRNPENLCEQQRDTVQCLTLRHLKTAQAYQIQLTFQEFHEQSSPEAAAASFKRWYFWATAPFRRSLTPHAPSSGIGAISRAGGHQETCVRSGMSYRLAQRRCGNV